MKAAVPALRPTTPDRFGPIGEGAPGVTAWQAAQRWRNSCSPLGAGVLAPAVEAHSPPAITSAAAGAAIRVRTCIASPFHSGFARPPFRRGSLNEGLRPAGQGDQPYVRSDFELPAWCKPIRRCRSSRKINSAPPGSRTIPAGRNAVRVSGWRARRGRPRRPGSCPARGSCGRVRPPTRHSVPPGSVRACRPR